MSSKRYLVLLGVIVFGAFGDCFLSRGMKQVGAVTLANWHIVFHVFGNPWIAAGVVLLLGYFASYLTSLSWADLTYVLPASAIGYVLVALIARFYLHEQVSLGRWLGIALIVVGVGFVTSGSHLTERPEEVPEPEAMEVGA